MSQKQISHIIEYSNVSGIDNNINMNINLDINDKHNNNNNNKDTDCYEKNNYNLIYNIAIDIVNSRNSYYLNNISLNE